MSGPVCRQPQRRRSRSNGALPCRLQTRSIGNRLIPAVAVQKCENHQTYNSSGGPCGLRTTDDLVSSANELVKQSPPACQSSLHLDNNSGGGGGAGRGGGAGTIVGITGAGAASAGAIPPVSADNEISAPEASTTIPPRQRQSQTARLIGPDSSPHRDGRLSATCPADRRAIARPCAPTGKRGHAAVGS
jgi:hypothetical protein